LARIGSNAVSSCAPNGGCSSWPCKWASGRAAAPTHVVPWILVAADRRASVLVQRVADLRVDVEHARVAETLDGWLRDLAAKTDEALSNLP
jgi:hypothetical protein